MKRFTVLAGLVIALAVPSFASAQTIFEQRLDTLGNRIEGIFTNDQYGHTVKSIEDQRTLSISLLRDHLIKTNQLLNSLDMMEADLARLVDGYVPIDHRCIELGVCAPKTISLEQPLPVLPLTPFDNLGAAISPPAVTTCTLKPDGTIDVCDPVR